MWVKCRYCGSELETTTLTLVYRDPFSIVYRCPGCNHDIDEYNPGSL